MDVSLSVDSLLFHRYLIEHGAQVGAVNSEGELPLDVATEDAMERLLKGEIKKQGEESVQQHLHLHVFSTSAGRCRASENSLVERLDVFKLLHSDVLYMKYQVIFSKDWTVLLSVKCFCPL